jgi:hypothetical protein
MVKKPVINVDDLEDAGNKAPSPPTDLVASVRATLLTSGEFST